MLKIEGVTHWSIPVNDLGEAEEFYGGLLGLKALGRLANDVMACFNVGDHNILLCERREVPAQAEDDRVHHSFTVSPETLNEACKLFRDRQVPVVELYYRKGGYFPGRELYFMDPSGNRLELRDPTWKVGMPEPTFDEVAAAQG